MRWTEDALPETMLREDKSRTYLFTVISSASLEGKDRDVGANQGNMFFPGG
jgi:hypothetical protein